MYNVLLLIKHYFSNVFETLTLIYKLVTNVIITLRFQHIIYSIYIMFM